MSEYILFLHISDIHINEEKEISDLHLKKIAEAINIYKSYDILHLFLIVTGDLTQSGKKYQFDNCRKIIGSLISNIRKGIKVPISVLVVPGNHDVDHGDVILSVDDLKANKYDDIVVAEKEKLKNFYNFAKFNNCFKDEETFLFQKHIKVKDYDLSIHFINNAIYSTIDEYKGLLYVPKEIIEKIDIENEKSIDLIIMHHSPDYFRDNIKNRLEEKVISRSSMLFHGHEHNNTYKCTAYEEGKPVLIQSCGALCDKGDWQKSSFIVGVLNMESKEYTSKKFKWNNESKQYEHSEKGEAQTLINCYETRLNITEEFKEFLNDNDFEKNYYTFPYVERVETVDSKSSLICTYDSFLRKIDGLEKIVITGNTNIGKTSLLKELFKSLYESKIVLFSGAEQLSLKSKKRQHNIEKLIKDVFEDMYGENESDWQYFQQRKKDECVFIFDDFDQIEGLDIKDFYKELCTRFGKVIIATNRTIEFDPIKALTFEEDSVTRFSIKYPVGNIRRQIVKKVVEAHAEDKSQIDTIVKQIDVSIKSQLTIIPPEPYFIIKVAENYMRNIGELVNSNTNVFSKVFEANITFCLENAIRDLHKRITVDLMFLLIGKIAYYIHFNKKYPIKRQDIHNIIESYNKEYGSSVITEDVLQICKRSKVLITSNDNAEDFRFSNKSLLAYFVAKEVIAKTRETKDYTDICDIINKSCVNICSDILLFIIFQTDDVTILKNLINSVSEIIKTDLQENEFDGKELPVFLSGNVSLIEEKSVNLKKEKEQLEETELEFESSTVEEFKVVDLYDWNDDIVDEYFSKVLRITALLQIVSKAFPCFDHMLKKEDKKELISYLYKLPNMIFNFWAKPLNENYYKLVEEMKTYPYFANKRSKKKYGKNTSVESDVNQILSMCALNLILSLYYIPALNSFRVNTAQYLLEKEFFNYELSDTYTLEHLMFLEQSHSDDFVKKSLNLKSKFEKNNFLNAMLKSIVRHGIITRNDTKENAGKLQSAFFEKSGKKLLIEKRKAIQRLK